MGEESSLEKELIGGYSEEQCPAEEHLL